jgi:thiamine-monophosphate kinase
MGEFELIERFFKRPVAGNALAHQEPSRVALGVGDDCALLQAAPGMQLAMSTDMLVEGRHFLSTVDPALLGHKALAVNLSDLAACGARPLAFSLALSLPKAEERWLEGFSRGLFALADSHGCELVGGDTTQGPLNICITVFGEVPTGSALLRSGARAGDDIYVSGNVGDARLALEVFRGRLSVPTPVFEAARVRLEQPTPRVALGLALRGIATAAIDISDGLAGDLAHVLNQSGVGARIDSVTAMGLLAAPSLPEDTVLDLVFSGGDDYELLFTAPAAASDAVQAAAASAATPVTRIGTIQAEPGLQLVDRKGAVLMRRFASFDHFA